MRDFAKLHRENPLSDLPHTAGVALLGGMALAFMGPANFERDGFFVQIGFWTSMSAMWFALSWGTAFLLSRSAQFRNLAPVRNWLLTVSLSLLPTLLLAAVALHELHGWLPSPGKIVQLIGRTILIVLLLEVLNRVLADGLIRGRSPIPDAIVAAPAPTPLRTLVPGPVHASPEGGEGESAAEPAMAHTDMAPTLLGRLPPPARGPILCLQMEDHYVRVHTNAGSALILMRFSDALLETAGVAGLRVHRSWWVAHDAVDGFARAGRTAQLALSNGLSVPVSQPYLLAASALAREKRLHVA